MSRTVPRPTITFRSARKVSIEAPEPLTPRPQPTPRGSVRDGESRNCARTFHKSDARAHSIDGSTNKNSSNNISCSVSDNSNNNNTVSCENFDGKINTIEVIHSTRRAENDKTWNDGHDSAEGCGDSSTATTSDNNITCSPALEPETSSAHGDTAEDSGSSIISSDSVPLSAAAAAATTMTTAAEASTTAGASEVAQSPNCDSSNNNSSQASSACVVDNLLMDAGQPRRESSEANKDTLGKTTVVHAGGNKGHDTVKVEMSPDVTFSDPRQSQVFQMLTGVQRLRHDTTFADIIVKVKDVEFQCHRFVLAINSPFLLALMNEKRQRPMIEDNSTVTASVDAEKSMKKDDLSEEQTEKLAESQKEEGEITDSAAVEQQQKEEQNVPIVDAAQDVSQGQKEACIEIKDMEPEIFEKMLDFMYCQFEGGLNPSNCLNLLLAAHTTQLPHLRRTCAAYVSESLSSSSVFQVLALCDAGYVGLFDANIMKRAHQVLRENFAQLTSAEEFLNLGRHLMIPLMADSMLHIRSEMEVLQALLKWVKFKPEERCSDMTLMLQHIRFPLMSSRELEKLREVPILHNNSLAMALIEESRVYGNLDYNERMAWPRHNSVSRCLFSTRDLILWTADRDKGLHFYSIIDGQHHKVTSFGHLTATENSGCGAKPASGNFSFDSTSSVCCYGDKVFFTGGEFNTDMVWSVDTSSGEVKVHAKMPRGRKFHSMVASKGCVYCLGGQDKRGYTVLEDVDVYIINKDMWVKVGHLAVPAYNMSAAVSGGAIYLVGGLDQAGQPLRLIQCFIALRSGFYSAFKVEINNMPPSLLSARAVTCGLDKSVYIVCGHGEVYQFQPDHQNLSHVTTLRNLSENPRVRFGLAFVGGCLVVIGGHQLGHVIHEPIRSVCFDIASKTEVRDYSPLLPGDIVNTCLAAKLSSNILRLFNE